MRNQEALWHEISDLPMNSISLLILDDVPYVRQLIAKEVSALDGVSDVYEAGNAPSAVSALKAYHPQIVVLDINVPGGFVDDKYVANGTDVLRVTKEFLPDSIAIMLTNNSNDFYRRECKKIGADFFFDKTNEFDTFLDQLQHLISDDKSWGNPQASSETAARFDTTG